MPSAVSKFSRACKPYLSPASAPGACGMVKLWGQDKGAYALAPLLLAPLLLATVLLATVLLVAGCGTPPAGSRPDLAGFAADDLGQYRMGPALDAESRRSK